MKMAVSPRKTTALVVLAVSFVSLSPSRPSDMRGASFIALC